jgi:hypothetical protein
MERRRSARVRADVPVITHQDGVAHHARAVDLSCGGALIQRTADHPPPMFQRLELFLGGTVPVRGVARTVWADAGMCAVHFVDLSDADRLEIAEHLDRSSRRRR